MLQIIHEREYITPTPAYFHEWAYPGHVSDDGRMLWGFSFQCAPDGTIDRATLAPEALANLTRLEAGQIEAVDLGIVMHQGRGYWSPAEGRCRCHAVVILDGFTNTCRCGRDYNSVGQELAPRAQWGDDTGESVSDILRLG